jgi:fibronectin-binding autotransporter adhesin
MNLQDNGTATATQSELLYAVAGLTSDQLAHAAKSLSGEVHADLAAASRASGIGLDNQVADHMESGNVADSDVSNGHVVWANTTRLGDRGTSDSQASGFQSGGNQVTAGVDIYRSDDAWIGVGVSHADTSLFGVDGSASITSNSGFVYGQHTLGRLLVDGLASYGSARWNTRRSDALGAGSLSGDADGHEALASLGLRLPIQMQGQTLEPFARVTWQRNRREGFNEDGSSISALQVQSFNDSGTRALAGVTLGTSHQDPFSTPVTYQVGAGVGVDTGSLLNPSVRSTFVGQSVDAQSPNVGRAFVQLNVSGTMALGKQTYLYAGITSETGHERSAYGATAGIRVAF